MAISGAFRAEGKMERVMRIELTWPAWKAGALPLSYTRIGTYIIPNFAPEWLGSRQAADFLAILFRNYL